MYRLEIPKLEILVAGDAGNEKASFINKLLKYFPSSAEVRRKGDTVHFLYNPDEDIKINLHDVYNVESINRSAYDKMDAVLFYYVANDPKSFQSLEKWIDLMGVEIGETKKMLSILVADSSNVDSPRDMAEFLAEKINKLTEVFDIKLFIQSSFKDDESASSAFKIIMNKVSPPKRNKQPRNGKEYSKAYLEAVIGKDRLNLYSDKHCNPNSSNCADNYLEKMNICLEQLRV